MKDGEADLHDPASLDGYIEDENGVFDWAAPDEEVHRFVNDLERPVRMYLYGRRMYETLAGWDTDPSFAEHSRATRDYVAVWQDVDEVVFSRTLQATSTKRTRIDCEFDER